MVSPDSRYRDSGNLYPIYIYITKIVMLVSEPVHGRSRATELPCFVSGFPSSKEWVIINGTAKDEY